MLAMLSNGLSTIVAGNFSFLLAEVGVERPVHHFLVLVGRRGVHVQNGFSGGSHNTIDHLYIKGR